MEKTQQLNVYCFNRSWTLALGVYTCTSIFHTRLRTSWALVKLGSQYVTLVMTWPSVVWTIVAISKQLITSHHATLCCVAMIDSSSILCNATIKTLLLHCIANTTYCVSLAIGKTVVLLKVFSFRSCTLGSWHSHYTYYVIHHYALSGVYWEYYVGKLVWVLFTFRES